VEDAKIVLNVGGFGNRAAWHTTRQDEFFLLQIVLNSASTWRILPRLFFGSDWARCGL